MTPWLRLRVPGNGTQSAQHLEECAECREELQRYRKLAVMLSRMPRALPPADLAVRIKVAAAQARGPTGLAQSRWQHCQGPRRNPAGEHVTVP